MIGFAKLEKGYKRIFGSVCNLFAFHLFLSLCPLACPCGADGVVGPSRLRELMKKKNAQADKSCR